MSSIQTGKNFWYSNERNLILIVSESTAWCPKRRASKISSILGSHMGLSVRDITFVPLDPEDVDDFPKAWGNWCDVTVAQASTMQAQSCGFFEALLRGVFEESKPTTVEMLALRKRVMTVFLEMWGDGVSHNFRTCAWDQPKFQRYVQGRTKFNLEELVNDWLGGTYYAVRLHRLMFEVFATAFSVQIGIVSLNVDREPFLFVYGQFSSARVYLAWNGQEDHLQRFFYFKQSENL